jgi:hypothetical protein
LAGRGCFKLFDMQFSDEVKSEPPKVLSNLIYKIRLTKINFSINKSKNTTNKNNNTMNEIRYPMKSGTESVLFPASQFRYKQAGFVMSKLTLFPASRFCFQ